MTHAARMRRRRRGSGRPRNKVFLATVVLATAGALAGLSLVGYVVSIASSAPALDTLQRRDPGRTSQVFAADGTRLGFIQSEELRQVVPGNKIPQVLKDATVAIEDERYYRHKGVDYAGVVRAAIKNLRSGKTIEGGSTITMQLVRALYISRERTYERKIREAKLAEELENEHTKGWILDTYLNSVPYGTVGGQSAIGVQAAARIYFSKTVEKLQLHEAALLAGLPQAPTLYSPLREPEAALARRNEVLAKMAELGMVTEDEAVSAIKRPLDINPSRFYFQRRESFFFDYVKDELLKEYGPKLVRQGGLRIDTTLDLRRQKLARNAIKSVLNLPGDPSAAIVTIDPRNGDILAMASSAEYSKLKFNLAAQGKRQPGSTFKVMGLMAAVKRGIDPESTTYSSKRLKFKHPVWNEIDVKTFDDKYPGSMNLVRATLRSDNSVYQQLALDIGPEAVKQAAIDMGIRTKLDGYPAEVLGGLTIGVSPLEMANAYATIASGGWRNRPRAITRVRFPDGTVEKPFKVKRVRAFEDWQAYEVADILEQNVLNGTGRPNAIIGCPAAGKTGTTSENTDAWFVGFTPRLSTSVWVGYPESNARKMVGVHGFAQITGGTLPAQIWGRYMKAAKGGFCGDFKKPASPPQWLPFSGQLQRNSPTFDSDGDGIPDSDSYSSGSGTTTVPAPGATAPAAPRETESRATPPRRDPEASPPAGGGGGSGETGDSGAGGGGGGGAEYDPDLYESPPQQPAGGVEGTATPQG